jgi:hypothetical protein
MRSRALSDPRRPTRITSPSRSRLDGSPTRHQSMASPRRCSVRTTCTVPSTEGPSSSLVMSSAMLPAGCGVAARKRSQAVTKAAMLPFMSAAIHRPGRHHVGVPGEYEERRRLAAAQPKVAHGAGIQTLGAKFERGETLREQILAARVLGRHRAARDQVSREAQGGRLAHSQIGVTLSGLTATEAFARAAR